MKTSERRTLIGWWRAALALGLGVVAVGDAIAQNADATQHGPAGGSATSAAALAGTGEAAAPPVADDGPTSVTTDARATAAGEVASNARRSAAGGTGELTLRTTSVSGNRELPRVMVVVPWKTAAPAELGGRPIVSLVEEALTPVDPDVFRRRLEYYALIHGKQGGEAGELATTASNLTEE